MAIIIKGKIRITDKTNSGISYKRLRVLAYDQDPQSDDDFMGSDETTNNGNYYIRVEKEKWDNAFKKNRRKPDVYIIVQYIGASNKGKGRWVKLYRSNQRTNASGTVVINPRITVRSETANTCFLPSKLGWNFGNSFKLTIPVALNIGFSIGVGFCGGMVFSAFDHYNKDKTIPRGSKKPKQGSSLYAHLFNRQLTSFNSGGVIAKVIQWINKADQAHAHRGHSVGYLTKKEMSEIKKRIKAGIAVPIVLVRHEGIGKTFKASDSHQVLIYKYIYEPTLNRTRFWIYDPNYKNEDKAILTVYQGYSKNAIYIYHNKQSRYRERGFFINKAYNKSTRKCKKN